MLLKKLAIDSLKINLIFFDLQHAKNKAKILKIKQLKNKLILKIKIE